MQLHADECTQGITRMGPKRYQIYPNTHTRKYIDIYCQMMNIQLYSNYALSHPHLAAQTIRPQARQWPMALALLTEAQEQRKANSPMLRRCALLPRFSCVSM